MVAASKTMVLLSFYLSMFIFFFTFVSVFM